MRFANCAIAVAVTAFCLLGCSRPSPQAPVQPVSLDGVWEASDGRGHVEFGGRPFANYSEDVSDVTLTLTLSANATKLDGSASAQGVEKIIGEAGDLKPIPPNALTFVFASGSRTGNRIVLHLKGIAANNPPTKAEFVGTVSPNRHRITGTLTITRTNYDQTHYPILSWKVAVRLDLRK